MFSLAILQVFQNTSFPIACLSSVVSSLIKCHCPVIQRSNLKVIFDSCFPLVFHIWRQLDPIPPCKYFSDLPTFFYTYWYFPSSSWHLAAIRINTRAFYFISMPYSFPLSVCSYAHIVHLFKIPQRLLIALIAETFKHSF